MSLSIYALLLVIFMYLFEGTNSHGRFMEPPNRSSIWRDSRFERNNPPKNYNDNELFCGEIIKLIILEQIVEVLLCGDPKSDRAPRANEVGGHWYRGIITGQYRAGQVIDIAVQLTTAHLGFMEWRLCSDHTRETQDCFNQNLLQKADGSGSKVYVTNSGAGWYRTQLRLPAGVTCNHCVIQWNYRAGNNWGTCGNGTGALGCGPQETFRGCSDVRIL